MAGPSYSACDAGIELAKNALERKGWSREDLADKTEVAYNGKAPKRISYKTVQSFFKQEPKSAKVFQAICNTLDIDWEVVCGQRTSETATRCKIFQAPPLPQFFVDRPEQLHDVKELMVRENPPGTLVVSAIYGLGGIGKSVLASALAHHSEIQERYSDGILWATLGQNPDLLPLLSGWIQALGDHQTKPTGLDSASSHLRTLFYDKRALLVVDDVWNPNHADWFRVGGENCCVLVTTRSARLSDVTRYDLDLMTESQSVELLTNAIHHKLSAEERRAAETLAKEVGYLPLALELAAARVEDGMPWNQLLQDLRSEVADLAALDRQDEDEEDDDTKRRKHSLVASFKPEREAPNTEPIGAICLVGGVARGCQRQPWHGGDAVEPVRRPGHKNLTEV
jgi:transcriptional regulator with XRE-family HTH domain